MISNDTAFRCCVMKMIRPISKDNRVTRAYAFTGRPQTNLSPVGTKVTLHRMVLYGVESHGTVRTRDDTFSATGTAFLVDAHDPGLEILGDRFRVNRTCP